MSNSKHNSKPVALFFQILVHCAKTLNFKTTALLTICWNWKKWLTFSKISFFKIFFQFSFTYLPTYVYYGAMQANIRIFDFTYLDAE